MRDAALTLSVLLRIGFTDEAAQFMTWLEARCHELAAHPRSALWGEHGHKLVSATPRVRAILWQRLL